MTQTYRTTDLARWGVGQGFNLTPAQVDINFWDLIQRMIMQEARPDPSAGIDYFEIIGINLYVHMTDSTVLGPYELPTTTFNDRGDWTPETLYSAMDTFGINGGLYVVLLAHTSDLTFDAGANNGMGDDYYQLMLQPPGTALPTGGAAAMVLEKATGVDFEMTWGYKLPEDGTTRQYLIKQSNTNQDAGWETPQADDIEFVPTTSSSLTSDNVAEALEELSTRAVDAESVEFTPVSGSSYTSDNVADALEEALTLLQAGAVAFTPVSGSTLLSANVADALEELAVAVEEGGGATTDAIQYVIDGGGTVLSTGLKGFIVVPYACTITKATLLADQLGSIVVDVYKCTFAQFDSGITHPVSGESITASAKPTISTAYSDQDTTLTGWTTSVAANSVLAFNVDSVTDIERITIALEITR